MGAKREEGESGQCWVRVRERERGGEEGWVGFGFEEIEGRKKAGKSWWVGERVGVRTASAPFQVLLETSVDLAFVESRMEMYVWRRLAVVVAWDWTLCNNANPKVNPKR